MLGRLQNGARKCLDASLWALSDADLADAVHQVHRLEQSIAAMKLHLVAEIEGRDLPGRQNFRATIAWLRSRTWLRRPRRRRLASPATSRRRRCAGSAPASSST